MSKSSFTTTTNKTTHHNKYHRNSTTLPASTIVNRKNGVVYGQFKDGTYYSCPQQQNVQSHRNSGDNDGGCDNGYSDLLDSGQGTQSSSFQSESASAKTSISSSGYDDSSTKTASSAVTTTNSHAKNCACASCVCNIVDSGISSPTNMECTSGSGMKYVVEKTSLAIPYTSNPSGGSNNNEVQSLCSSNSSTAKHSSPKSSKYSLRFFTKLTNTPPSSTGYKPAIYPSLITPPQSPIGPPTSTVITTPNGTSSGSGGNGGITGFFVNRIRSISLGPSSQPQSPTGSIGVQSFRKASAYTDPNNNNISQNSLHNQEPDPTKLPKEKLNASINFTSKHLKNSKKWTRMSHSLSCDVEAFNVPELTAKSKNKLPSSMETLLSTESPAVHRIEKYLNGQVHTSTANGVLLSAMKHGLRKVSDGERYMFISKSPLGSPQDFGIEHLAGDADILLVSLTHCSCYDLMPANGKMVVLDAKITITKAFRALDENFANWALVWCSKTTDYIGVLSKDDLVFYLLMAYEIHLNNDSSTDESGDKDSSNNDMESLSNVLLDSCIAREPERHQLHLISPECVISEALQHLYSSTTDCLLVKDNLLSGNALFFLTYSRILALLMELASKTSLPLPGIFKTRIGAHDQLLMPRRILSTYRVQLDSSLQQLLHVMSDNQHKCALLSLPKQPSSASCLCVHTVRCGISVDHIEVLTSMSKHHDPHMTVDSVLKEVSQSNASRSIKWCTEDDTLFDLMKLFVTERGSLVLIRPAGESCVHGIVSPRELVRLLAAEQYESTSSTSSRGKRTLSCSGSGYSTLISTSTTGSTRRQGFRSVSCCEETMRNSPDMNLSAVSLDEKDEDVFNMEIS